MEKTNAGVEFLFTSAKFQAIMSRKLDSRLGGLGFTEFQILYYIRQSEGGRMRRTDLAEKLGLTQSGITRILLPMEKIGLVKKEADKNDARVSYVTIGRGGQEKLEEGIERAELFVEDTIPSEDMKKLQAFTKILQNIV